MTEQNEKNCLNCNRTDEQVPLLHLTFKNETKYICPQCQRGGDGCLSDATFAGDEYQTFIKNRFEWC